MTKNAITNSEVLAYRLCHHSFDGLSIRRAATKMAVSPRRAEQLLVDLEAKAPQLFPILTSSQARDYHLYTEEGWTLQEIADDTDRGKQRVNESISAAVAKGMPKPKLTHKKLMSCLLYTSPSPRD